jgi:hypothetical protein
VRQLFWGDEYLFWGEKNVFGNFLKNVFGENLKIYILIFWEKILKLLKPQI